MMEYYLVKKNRIKLATCNKIDKRNQTQKSVKQAKLTYSYREQINGTWDWEYEVVYVYYKANTLYFANGDMDV